LLARGAKKSSLDRDREAGLGSNSTKEAVEEEKLDKWAKGRAFQINGKQREGLQETKRTEKDSITRGSESPP